ncbi:MAG: NAD(P)/FAD-dependent oxidoreductase [Saprospiraceae bacterium]|nr:NAD(P)/FAD-dependent oxidoreductase [Saprospiraceae bacterium]
MNELGIENLIIGAGPAGMAVAGRMSKKGIPYQMIEQGNHPGERWHHQYDRLHLHTIKELSHLPHLSFPDDYPRYIPKDLLIKYFQQYAITFGIKPNFNVKVLHIEQINSDWRVQTDGGIHFLCKHVILATGANRVPVYPSWEGMSRYEGRIIHSRHYRNPEGFEGQAVLVVGMGNTGAEIALDLAEQNINVAISVRSPINIVPRDVAGRPSQLTGKMLEKVPFSLGDLLGSLFRNLVVGNLNKYGLKSSPLSPAAQLRKTGKTPVIDIGTVDYIKQGKIQIKPNIVKFTSDGVLFADGTKTSFDAVILATGYRPMLDELLGDSSGLLNKHGVPTSAIGQGKHRGLYFVGFDQYQMGGILGTIREDSKKVVKHIAESTVAK